MFNRVSAETLQPRLDADYYKKEFIENDRLLRVAGAVRLASLIDTVKSSYGVLPKSEEYVLSGVPLIRGGDLSFGQIKPPEVHAPTSYAGGKGTAYEGDVLILIKGACIDGPEGVARVSENERGFIFNGSCYRLAFKNREVDGYFFIAYSQTRQFLMQKKRQVANTGISYNDEDSILGYLLPELESVTKKYIGDKVRQAERLRAWANLAESSVTRHHQALVPSQLTLNFAKRVRLVSPVRMSERLDAHFYPGVVDDYLRLHQGKFKPLGKLCTTIYNGQTQSETSSANSCKQITVTNLSSSFLGGTPRDVEMPGKKEKFLKPYDILMCNAAHNKAYIGKDLTFVHSEAAILPSTEVMTLRVDRNQVPASYVRAYLLTKLGYVQIQSTIRGITAHSYPDDMALLDIFVPELEDKYKEEWFACDEKLALAGKACEIATQLTNAAKSLVEALIEGQLAEADLIAAEQALQAGNDQPDRQILNRLKTDGVDGRGQALFSDIDQLYRLLEQANEPAG